MARQGVTVEPRQIAHFEVLGRLGEGGWGVVYRARDLVLQREVALKLIRSERAGDPQARRRFLREARAAANLNHPGIAAVHEAGEFDPGDGSEPQLYLAEELVTGTSLAERLRKGPFSVAEAVQLGVELADALAEAHAHGIVHRDIKPSNLMLTAEGRLKVLDFGLAKHGPLASALAPLESCQATLSQTIQGVIVGTPAYMAPEQIAGSSIDARVDVYAAGCVLYEMLAGQRPHVGAHAAEVLRRAITEAPRPILELRPDVPPGVAAVVARATARVADERYPTARELATALREAERASPPRDRPRSRRVAAITVSAATLAALATLAWFVLFRPAATALAFNERDFVLVADVANETGEAVFDVALKSALETDLHQSRYVNVLEPSQLENLLRLTRLAPDTRIDATVGRNLCLRAGARALVVPGVLRAGDAYLVQASLIEPSTGRVADLVKVAARSREEVLLSAIDELTRRLRRRLGESLGSIARTDPPFAEYTTSSLEALQLLGLGRRAWVATDYASAERCFRQALEHDPRFAAARGSLGLVLIQFAGRPEEGKQMLARALEDAGQASQREHLHLRALNKQFVTGDLPGALDDYRFMSELYPDSPVPYNNSGRILEQLDRLPEAAEMYERAHEADAQNPFPMWNAYFLYANRLRDPQAAERIARALVALAPDSANAAHGLAWSLVMQRRFDEAESGMRTVLSLDPHHPYALPNLAHLLLRRGAAEDAVATYRLLDELPHDAAEKTNPDHSAICLGLALRAAGRPGEAIEVARTAIARMLARGREPGHDPMYEALLASLLAQTGSTAEARAHLATAEREDSGSGAFALWSARAHVALGDDDRAAALVREALEKGHEDPYFVLIDPTLATIRERPEIGRLMPPAIRSASARR